MAHIGNIKDMTDEQLAGKVVDSLTGNVYETNEDYLSHTSGVTGYTPKDAEHFGSHFVRVQRAVAKRCGFLSTALEEALIAKEKKVRSEEIDVKLTNAALLVKEKKEKK